MLPVSRLISWIGVVAQVHKEATAAGRPLKWCWSGAKASGSHPVIGIGEGLG